ncbi:MAG TPA: endonuclease [Dehalococcoidia bacterium]|jgi:predicted Holliday junction resolvase-like endonuclease|nr:endonuclease [Dehalococcoidia bacterium]
MRLVDIISTFLPSILVIYSICITIAMIITAKILIKTRVLVKDTDSKLRSVSVKKGLDFEQWIPLSSSYPYNSRNFRFLGSPIDGIQFEDEKIVFIEFKSGKSRMVDNQRKIRNLIENGKIEFHEIRSN